MKRCGFLSGTTNLEWRLTSLQVRRDHWRRQWTQLAVGGCCRPVEGRRKVVVDNHRRVPSATHRHVPRHTASSAAADAGAATETRHHLSGQHLAKACVEDGVDWEVDGRVGDDKHVTDATVVELKAATVARRVIQHVPEDLVE